VLLFGSNDTPELAADREGTVALSPHELVLVIDRDVGGGMPNELLEGRST
jgi:hypothetical protein